MAVLTLTSAFTVATSLARGGSSFDFAAEDQALLSDDSRTSLLAITPPADGYTNYLVVKNLATKVPMGSIIRTLQFSVECQDTDALARTVVTVDSCRVLQNNALAGSDLSSSEQVPQGATDGTIIANSSASLFGLSWMAGNGTGVNDINSAGFGVALSFLIDQSSAGGTGVPAIDYVTASITYELRRSSAFWLLLGR